MGLSVRIEDEDYPGISEASEPTSIPGVFTDATKNEIMIVTEKGTIIITV